MKVKKKNTTKIRAIFGRVHQFLTNLINFLMELSMKLSISDEFPTTFTIFDGFFYGIAGFPNHQVFRRFLTDFVGKSFHTIEFSKDFHTKFY